MADLPNNEKNRFVLEGPSGQDAVVDNAGRLSVSNNTVVPQGGSLVTRTAYSSITATTDDFYTIPNGKILSITRFSAGAESSTSGSVIELFEDPNGDLSVLNIIDTVFASGLSDQHDINSQFTGNGTRRILLRRRRFGGGAKSVFGRWEGFET